jgi:hypothetical protein
MLLSKRPLKRSAKKYLKKVLDYVERLRAELTIAKNELQQLKAVVEGRKRKQTRKRLVIKDKMLVTNKELVERIRAAEAETAARKNKRRTKRIRLKLNLTKKN